MNGRPEDLGYESTYEELRPQAERAMAQRLRDGMAQVGVDPDTARIMGAPSAGEMRNALQWAIDLGVVTPLPTTKGPPGAALEPYNGQAAPPSPALAQPSNAAGPVLDAPARQLPPVQTIRPSEHSWEQDALAYLHRAGAYTVVTNFDFILNDAVWEVDALVVAHAGVFLIEIKNWSGRLRGDAGTWTRTKRNGSIEALDHPLLLADRKAKRLKSLICDQRAFADWRAPFITPLVFLSHPHLDCQLGAAGRQGVFGPDGHGELPGILARISPKQPLRVEFETAARVAEALGQAGIRTRRQAPPRAAAACRDPLPQQASSSTLTSFPPQTSISPAPRALRSQAAPPQQHRFFLTDDEWRGLGREPAAARRQLARNCTGIAFMAIVFLWVLTAVLHSWPLGLAGTMVYLWVSIVISFRRKPQ